MRYIVKINKDRCKNCGLCLEVCPVKMFKISKEFNKIGYHYIEVNNDKVCKGCKKCVIICPDTVIEIYKDE